MPNISPSNDLARWPRFSLEITSAYRRYSLNFTHCGYRGHASYHGHDNYHGHVNIEQAEDSPYSTR